MITVIDSPCGSGKTYKMMEMIRNNPNNRFIYITPFLDEIDRMRKQLKEDNIEMYTPDTRNDKHTKIEGAKSTFPSLYVDSVYTSYLYTLLSNSTFLCTSTSS